MRFIIGSTNHKHAVQMAKFLISQGFEVIGTTDDGYELLRKVHTTYPDFVIIDGNMKGMKGNEICEVVVNDKLCAVITLINSGDKSIYINLEQELIFKAIVKPLKKQEFLNSIDFMYKGFQQIKQLENQVKQLSDKISKSSLIDQSKKLLMKHLDLSEEEAHRKIQKESMDRGIPKDKIARIIMMKYK